MSDLHCAATLLLAAPAAAAPQDGVRSVTALTVAGRAQARDLARSLVDDRVTTIHCADAVPAVQTGEVVAGVLGVHVQVHQALGGASAGEQPSAAAERVAGELQSLVDQHRGETVLVVCDEDTAELALARVLPSAPDARDRAGVLAIAADADGWVVRPRPGETARRREGAAGA